MRFSFLSILLATPSIVVVADEVFHFPEAANKTQITSPAFALPLHRNASLPYLVNLNAAAPAASTTAGHSSRKKRCIVKPRGWGQDDSSQILAAVERCGINGTITFPAPYVYTISRRMHMRLENAKLEIFGTWSFTPDLLYWINNSFNIEFQNQSTAWVVEGRDFEIDGGGWARGGIEGNGQAWMTRAAGQSNQYGRPIPLSIFNATNVHVKDFSVRQPMFWAFYVQDSAYVKFTGIYVNGTNTDPAGNSSNYETNIDGLDTLRVNQLLLADWLFHGGDDCFAPKGNSTNMVLRNMTCHGGGIAFGSIGQYPDSPDYITNVTASNITVLQEINARTGGASVSGGAYFKSWVGVSAGTPPQGGGGGTGKVSNVSFTGLSVHNVSNAIYINKCYFKVANQSQFCDTSTLNFGGLSFSNVSGTVSGSTGIALNCSASAPCGDITLKNVALLTAKNATATLTCVNALNVAGAACNSTLS